MKRNRVLVWCSLCGFLSVLVAQTAVGHGAAGPYGAILGGNVFRLRVPEPPIVDLVPKASASIRLTGITTLLAHKVAFLKVRMPANPPGSAQELALSLEEGQSQGNIAVLSINEKAGEVEMLNFGTRMTVAFGADSRAPTERAH